MNGDGDALPLAAVLRRLALDVVGVQDELDRSFVSARAARDEHGGPAPVWYRLDDVRVTLGLRTTVRGGERGAEGLAAADAAGTPEFLCRLPDPVAVALYGNEAVATTTITVAIGPLVSPLES